MENKIFYKKYIRVIILTCLIFFFLIEGVILLEQNHYKKEFNQKISSIIAEVQKKDPTITTKEILEILNSEDYAEPLRVVGYDIEKDDFFKNSKNNNKIYTISITLTTVGFLGIIIYLFIKYSSKNDKEIDNIIRTLENINQKKYDLELETLSEDKFSILKSELYKTTVMLKEVAENSKNAKNNLKNSLSDISHQLKTPLTSILIMLDDIIDDKDMPEETRDNFLKSIRREIMNINFLVQTILKLSKFDANAIEFNRKSTSLESIIESVIENTSTLADLKNVKIEKDIERDKEINCDEHWQIEALTNVVKNAIEHSKENSSVKISANSNDLVTTITIKDEGVGMSKKDIKHIFDRFYKGENSAKDSIGIGLSLAKAIIEEDNGKITVNSKIDEGTTFTIKYYNNHCKES